jgi:lysozyme family protein
MAMINIDQLINDLISREGGFVNKKADKGGPTKYGITIKTLSQYLHRAATISDVQNLDMATAKEIYLVKYYKAPRFDTLPEPVQPQAFDIGVNSGPEKAIQMMQRICNSAGFGPIDADGVLGPESHGAINKAYSAMGGYFINAIEDERVAYYEYLVKQDPSQQEFIKGWLNRAQQFKVAV